MDFKAILERIYSFHSETQPCHLPGWWMIVLQDLQENHQPEEEDSVQWQSLLKNVQKVMQIWLKKLRKWEVNSWNTLEEKLSKVPGGISAMSYSTEMATNFGSVFASYAAMAEPDETECLDFQSKMTTSTSSTIVPMLEDTAGTSGGSKLNLLENLDQLAQKTSPYGSSHEPTGMMSSNKKKKKNGELVKYGLEEKIGKHRLTINWYDGKKSITLGDKWYEAKIAGATLSVNDKATKELVEQLLLHLSMKFMARNPKAVESMATSNRKRRRFY